MSQEQASGCQQAEEFRVRIGEDESFDELIVLEDPVPTGRQIIQKANRSPIIEHQLLLRTNDGQIEEIGLEETVDLRERGAVRIVISEAGHLSHVMIDDGRLTWGSVKIKEATLRFLVGAGSEYSVWQERRRQDDLLIAPGTSACLTAKGVEVFFTGKDETNAG